MKRKMILFISTLSILLLNSCSKHIEGQVFDNFGHPIQDVNVSIQGTQFLTKTDSKGSFELDYTPGTFAILFENAEYATEEKDLNISKKQRYPLEKTQLVRIPANKTFYLQSEEKSDYIEIPKMNFSTVKSTTKSLFSTSTPRNLIFENADSIFVIKLKSLEGLKMYDWTRGNWKLSSPTPEGNFATLNFNFTTQYVQLFQPKGEKIKTHPTKTFKVRETTWEFDKVYAYINIKEAGLYKTLQSYTGYVFKFEKE